MSKAKNSLDSKLKTTFTVFVVFVLLAAVAVVFLGIDVTQPQLSQEKQQESDVTSTVSSTLPQTLKPTDEKQKQQQQQVIKEDLPTTAIKSQEEEEESRYIYLSEMSCSQLSDFISSFEDGWGKAVAEFSSRCE